MIPLEDTNILRCEAEGRLRKPWDALRLLHVLSQFSYLPATIPLRMEPCWKFSSPLRVLWFRPSLRRFLILALTVGMFDVRSEHCVCIVTSTAVFTKTTYDIYEAEAVSTTLNHPVILLVVLPAGLSNLKRLVFSRYRTWILWRLQYYWILPLIKPAKHETGWWAWRGPWCPLHLPFFDPLIPDTDGPEFESICQMSTSSPMTSHVHLIFSAILDPSIQHIGPSADPRIFPHLLA